MVLVDLFNEFLMTNVQISPTSGKVFWYPTDFIGDS